MPLALEPNKKLPIVLDCDKDKPVDSRPTFYFPSVSMRRYDEIGAEIDACVQEGFSLEQLLDAHCAFLAKHCVGWSNMDGRVFGETDFRDLLTYQEARELMTKFLRNQHVSIDEKKSSVSQPA